MKSPRSARVPGRGARGFNLLFGLLAFPLFATSLSAAVEAIQIRLVADLGQSAPISYQVPSGKVLIIEHVVFTNYWDISAQEKVLTIRNGGVTIGGNIWDTAITYSGNFNTLFRPLKLPAGTGISLKHLDNSSLLVFIYGLLVDEADLYASVPMEHRDFEVAANRDGSREYSGRLELESPRPAAIEGETSEDLQNWEENPEIAITPGASPPERDYHLSVADPPPELFVRFSARALIREEYPFYTRIGLGRDILAADGTVTPPFLTPEDVDLETPAAEAN